VYDPAAGATQVADVLPEINERPFGQAVPLDGKLYFRSWSPIDGGKLWSHDPANPNDGATFLTDVSGVFTDDDPDDLVAFNGKLYFTISGNPVVGREIWMFDPTNPGAGVTLAFDIDPGTGSGRDSVDDFIPADFSLAMVELDGSLYLNGQNGLKGHELMVLTDTDSTIEVALAVDINPGEADGFPVHMVTLDNKLYFRADDGVHGQELWEFDPACGSIATLVALVSRPLTNQTPVQMVSSVPLRHTP
jgi:ELWxxDGT repeat protein